MGFRFRRSKSLGKFGKINLTKGGLGISVGPKGARIGIGPRGAYTSAGIPGTGIYAINYVGKKQRQTGKNVTESGPAGKTEIAVPKALKPPAYPVVILIVSIILLFSLPLLALAGFIAVITFYVKNNNSKKAVARREFLSGKKALQAGDMDQALVSFRSVLDYDSNLVSIYPILAELYRNKEMNAEAAGAYAKYLASVPGDHGTYINYAIALADSGKVEEGIGILQSLPEELKNSVEIITLLGSLFIKLGKSGLALKVLQQGPVRKRKMDEQLMGFQYMLGMAYKENGERKKAIKQFQRVYAADMNFMDVKEILAELEGASSSMS